MQSRWYYFVSLAREQHGGAGWNGIAVQAQTLLQAKKEIKNGYRYVGTQPPRNAAMWLSIPLSSQLQAAYQNLQTLGCSSDGLMDFCKRYHFKPTKEVTK